jgi:large subunit ribosomal protein L10e
MGIRPGRATRTIKRPWTRVSKKKPRKSYVVGAPYSRIHIFDMGNPKKEYDSKLWLSVERSVQIRDNALEAARIVANKLLEKVIGPENYFMKVLVFPHHILREHSMATGAGADRFSSGMQRAFGKPSGRAVQVKRDQRVMVLKIDKKNLEIGKKALKRAHLKLPTPCKIIVE